MRLIDADLLELEYTMSMSKDNHRTIAGSLVHAQEHQHIIHLLRKAPTVVNTVSEERCREIANEMIPQFVRQARADAIKEFAEKLKSKLFIADDNFNPVVTESEIDNVAKEMVGVSLVRKS